MFKRDNLFLSRREALRLTWLSRIALLACVGLLLALTRGYWVRQTARSLICRPDDAESAKAVLLESFDLDYPPFQKAVEFQRHGVGRILVPVAASSSNPATPNLVDGRLIETMANIAGLRNVELIPVPQREPIVLNAAYSIRRFLVHEQIRSVAIVVPAFRSRRSDLVYTRVLGEAGIGVACVPLQWNGAADRWSETWHGIQDVTEQFLKLQYYRFYVLPFVAAPE